MDVAWLSCFGVMARNLLELAVVCDGKAVREGEGPAALTDESKPCQHFLLFSSRETRLRPGGPQPTLDPCWATKA